MWNKLYNIEFLRKYKICCVHPIVEDDLFLFQTLFCSSSCCLISDITYFYYVNPLSITNTLMKENISLSVAKYIVIYLRTNIKLQFSVLLGNL